MNRWQVRLAAVAAAAAVWVGCGQSAFAAPPRPNVVVIVADDLGYADIGAQGISKDVKTPNIDSIAANGVRFTSGYVSCPVCSPTRAGIMTGRYQQRFGHEFNPGPNAPANFGIPLDQVTIADDFKHAGYATGAIGKWHLGDGEKFRPQQRGFEEFFGFLGGSHTYVNNERPNAPAPIFRDNKPISEPTYLTDAITRESTAFIDRHKDQPFFLYVAYNAIHTPQAAPEKYQKRFAGVKDETRKLMLSMLSAEDDGVGEILQHLRDAKLEENTLIVFISDNGGPTATNGSVNTPLSGFKSQVWEGGIRVPYMMQWKGQIPVGKVIDQPVISLDILPTALAAANVPLSKQRDLDGVNLLPLLQGKSDRPPHESLCWRMGGQSAIRQGDYKLVMIKAESAKLYDLKADIGETHDLAAAQPAVLAKLQAAYQQWDAGNAKALWQPAKEQKKAAKAGRRNATTRPTTVADPD